MQISTLFKTSYNYLLFAAIVMSVTSLFYHEVFDYHIRYNYLTIEGSLILKAYALLVFFIWVLYFFIHRVMLKKWLAWLHVASLLLPAIVLFASSAWFKPTPHATVKYYILYNQFDEEEKRLMLVIIPSTLLFLAGQLAFFINTIGGCIKYLIKKNR